MPYLVSSLVSFPEMTLRTTIFEMISAFWGSLTSACCSAASASSKRPRWISATACETRLCVDDVAGACASSSKT